MTVRGLGHLGPPRPYPDPDDLRRKWTYWFAQHRPWAELKPRVLRNPAVWSLRALLMGAASAGQLETVQYFGGIAHRRAVLAEALRCHQWDVAAWCWEKGAWDVVEELEAAMPLNDTAVLDWLASRLGAPLQLASLIGNGREGRRVGEQHTWPCLPLFDCAARAGALNSLKWVEQHGGWTPDNPMLETLMERASEAGSVACLVWLAKRQRYGAIDVGVYFLAPPVEAAPAIADWVLGQTAYHGAVTLAVREAILEQGQLALVPWFVAHAPQRIESLVAHTLWQRKEEIAIVLVRYLPPDSPFLASLLALVPPRK
jgi:hypothetical protein